MKIATITIRAVFADDVTDEMIHTIASNAWVQVDEPVVGWDEDGNEIALAYDTYQAVDVQTEIADPMLVTDGVVADYAAALRNV